MSEYEDYTNEELHEYFIYLNELRESGLTNMYGAAPYLKEEFTLGTRGARKVLMHWMDSFDKSGICMLPGKND